jgi:hypothetical protein
MIDKMMKKDYLIFNINNTNRSFVMNRVLKYFLVLCFLIPILALSSNAEEVLLKHVITNGSMIRLFDGANKTQMYGSFGQASAGKIVMAGTSQTGTAYMGWWSRRSDAIPGNDVKNGEVASSNLTNYPNPVASTTTFEYDLPGSSDVSLKLYDISGKLIKVLYSGYQSAGKQSVNYDVTDSDGLKLQSGSYMYELVAVPYNLAGGGAFDPIHLRNIMMVVK